MIGERGNDGLDFIDNIDNINWRVEVFAPRCIAAPSNNSVSLVVRVPWN